MNKITLPFNWNEAHKSQDRYVFSNEGIKVDLLNLSKVDLNNKLDHDGYFIYFKDEQVVMPKNDMTIIEFLKNNPLKLVGIGDYKTHCLIDSFDSKNELLNVSYTDSIYGVNLVKWQL